MNHKITKHERAVLEFLFRHKDETPPFNAIRSGTGLSHRETRRALRGLKQGRYIDGPKDVIDAATEFLAAVDIDFKPTASGYSEHLILAASAISKADESFLAAELDFDDDFVALVGSRLRNSGVWDGPNVSDGHMKEWCHEEQGGVAFLADGAVATGDIMIVGKDENGGGYLMQMTESGKTHAANIIKRASRS